MLLSPASVLPTGEEWAFEVKWDSMRAVVSVNSADRIHSRHGLSRTGHPRALFGRAKVVLNSELVCLDPPRDGPPSSASWPGAYASRSAHVRGGG